MTAIATKTDAPVISETVLTSDIVLERVRALLPGIGDRAAQGEADRTIPQESVDELLEAGITRILAPKMFGGAELGLRTWIDVVLEISAADAAHGWCASLLIHHPHYYAQFPEAAQRAVWADGPDVPISCTLTPTSKIDPVDGATGSRARSPISAA